MTSYEHYQAVANYVISTWTTTPVFMLGEVIDIPPPYLVLKAYGVNNISTISGKIREDIKGFTIFVYTKNRGLNESIISDLLDTFTMVDANGIIIEDVIQTGDIGKLEDALFESTLSFLTRNIVKRN